VKKAVESLVRRPYLAAALALMALIAAVLAIPSVPVALYPSVARPAISVSCTYPGANAREVMNTVAGPIEEQVNGVEGMSRMTSSCSDTGSYSLTVYFHIGFNRDLALMKVQSKVQQALSLLPQEVKNTGVTVETGSTEELGILTLRSKTGKMTREEVVDYAYGVVNPAILRVPGVGKSTVKDNKVAMRVWLDAKRMAAHGINTEEVVSAIKAQNVQASLGSVGASPTAAPDSRVISLISKGRLDKAEDFEKIVVRTEAGGGLVRLGDIARIDKGQQGYAYAALYDETPAVYILIHQLPGVDVRKTMATIKRELTQLEASFPSDLAWDMTYDTSRYMMAALRSALLSGALAFALALVVAGLFLHSLRGTLVVALAAVVPVAVAFTALVACGYFANVITLYAFSPAVALACAFAAAMAGRIARHQLVTGCDMVAAAEAVLPGAMAPFLGAGVAIALAMVPVAMIDGMQGVVFRQFAFVLGVSSPAAALSALLVVPPLAARLLRRRAVRAYAGKQGAVALPGGAAVLVFAACGLAAWALARELPQEFIPDEDMGVVIVDCKTAEGTSMPITADVMRRIYRRVRAVGGIEKSATLLGESVVSGYGENNAKTYLILDDWSRREKSSVEMARAIHAEVADTPEAAVFTLRPPPMPGQGAQSGLCVLIQSMEDADPVRFAHEAQRLRAAFARSPLCANANCGAEADVPHLRVFVDREKCELMQVPMSSLYTTLQHALGSVYVNDVNLGTQVNRVTVMADWSDRATQASVAGLYVRSKTGEMVPVDTLVTFGEELGVRDCYRCNKYLYCSAQYMPKPGVSSSEAIADVRRIAAETLPRGYVQDWGGLVYEQFQARGDTGLLVALAILAAYLVLMVTTGSFVRPFACLLPTLAALLGAVLLHAATGVAISLYSQMAMLLTVVIGAVLGRLTPSGESCFRRGLPAFLMAAAMLPLACALGAGSAGSRSLGVTLAGGFVCLGLVTILIRPPEETDARDGNP